MPKSIESQVYPTVIVNKKNKTNIFQQLDGHIDDSQIVEKVNTILQLFLNICF